MFVLTKQAQKWLITAVQNTLTSGATCSSRRCRKMTDAVIRVYDEAGNVIETQEHKGEFKE